MKAPFSYVSATPKPSIFNSQVYAALPVPSASSVRCSHSSSSAKSMASSMEYMRAMWVTGANCSPT